MPLFDTLDRTDLQPATYGVPSFAYLNRSGRPAAGAVRALFNAWFVAYPEEHRSDLRRRFRSDDDPAHLAAAFELTLFGLFTCLGCELSVLKAKTPTPDFVVTHPSGSRFTLEATVAMARSQAQMGADRRKAGVIDAINDLKHPRFRLDVTVASVGQGDASKVRLTEAISEWLDGLHYEEFRDVQDANETESLPRTVYRDGDWVIDLRAIPLPRSSVGSLKGRMIWLLRSQVETVTSGGDVFTKLKKKARRQRLADTPHVVAVNCLNHGIEQVQAECLLYGTTKRSVAVDAALRESGAQGIWLSRRGPVCTSMSGAMVFSRAEPWMLASPVSEVSCFHNPWAALHLHDATFDPLPTCQGVDGRLSWRGEATLARVLGLPDGWPSDDP